MIRLRSSQFATLCLLILSVPAFATEDSPVIEVSRSDGSFGEYRLLPVHYDPTHASHVFRRHALSATLAPPTPDSYSIPAQALPPIRDQGQRATCAYFSTLGLIETHAMAQSTSNNSPVLSVECLADVRDWMFDQGDAYTGDDKPDARPDPAGDFPASIIKTIARNGVPAVGKYSSSADCTYVSHLINGGRLSLTDYLSVFGSAVSAPSLPYGKGLTFDLNTAPTIDAIKSVIASGVPVEVGVVLYGEFRNQVDWRYDPKLDTEADIAGGHAITLTGYETQNGKTVFTFKNSWSERWGNNGYGTLDDALLINSWGYDSNYDFALSVPSHSGS